MKFLRWWQLRTDDPRSLGGGDVPVGSGSPEKVGNQTGGRVFLFLNTDNFERDYQNYISKGVEFTIAPHVEAYGTVAVFKDFYGNLWDLIEPS